MVLWDI